METICFCGPFLFGGMASIGSEMHGNLHVDAKSLHVAARSLHVAAKSLHVDAKSLHIAARSRLWVVMRDVAVFGIHIDRLRFQVSF